MLPTKIMGAHLPFHETPRGLCWPVIHDLSKPSTSKSGHFTGTGQGRRRRIAGWPADFSKLPWVLFWGPGVVKIGFLAKNIAVSLVFIICSTDF